jgi:light-regulated signal transduction histidine kinase (bacteriophytochrome)
MDDMIEGLLDRTRTDAIMGVRQRSGIDLVAVVRQMLDQTIAPDDRARVTLDAIPTLPVVVEVAQIERVVVNLLTNALKFSARDTAIVSGSISRPRMRSLPSPITAAASRRRISRICLKSTIAPKRSGRLRATAWAYTLAG